MNARMLAVLLAVVALGAGGVAGWYYYEKEQLATDVAAANQSLRELRTTVRSLELTQATLENQNITLENQNTSLQSTIEQLTQRQKDITASAESTANELAELRRQRSDLQAELVSARDAAAALQTERDTLQTQAREAQNENEQLQAELAEQRMHIAAMEGEIVALDTLVAQLEMEADERAQRTTALEEEVKSNLTTIARLHEELSQRGAELQQARNTISGREETLSELNTRLAREQNALLELQNRLNLAEQEREDLVAQNNGITVIKLPERILFPSGSAALTEEATTVLQEVATAIDSFPQYTLSIVGHSDARTISSALQNSYPSNWELSSARASAAVRALASMGVDSSRMKAVGVADTQPLVEEVDAATRQQNRRIEVIFEPPLPVRNGAIWN